MAVSGTRFCIRISALFSSFPLFSSYNNGPALHLHRCLFGFLVHCSSYCPLRLDNSRLFLRALAIALEFLFFNSPVYLLRHSRSRGFPLLSTSAASGLVEMAPTLPGQRGRSGQHDPQSPPQTHLSLSLLELSGVLPSD